MRIAGFRDERNVITYEDTFIESVYYIHICVYSWHDDSIAAIPHARVDGALLKLHATVFLQITLSNGLNFFILI